MSKHNARLKIEQAMLTLVERRRFSEISVEDIIALAQVNRSSFYYHYCDKYALRDALMEKLMSRLRESMPLRENSDCIPQIEDIAKEVGRLHTQRELFLRMTSPNWEIDTVSVASSYFEERALLWAENQPIRNYSPELFARIYAASAVATVLWSFQNDVDEQTVARMISEHLRHGFFRAFTEADKPANSDRCGKTDG